MAFPALALLACLVLPQDPLTFMPGPAMNMVEEQPHGRILRIMNRGLPPTKTVATELLIEQRTHGLQGHLVDASGAPVPFTILGARPSIPQVEPNEPLSKFGRGADRLTWKPMRDLRSVTMTDAEGAFTLTELWPGGLELFTVHTSGKDGALFPVSPDMLQANARGITITLSAEAAAIPDLNACLSTGEMDAGKGLLQIAVVTPRGQPHDWYVRVRLWALDPDHDGKDVLYFYDRGPVFRKAVPPGRYSARVECRERAPMCASGWTPIPSWLMPTEIEVEVLAGQVTRSFAKLQQAGRMRLLLTDLPGAPPIFNPALDPNAAYACNRLANAVRDAATPRRIRLWLSSADQAERKPLRLRIPGCLTATGWHLLPDQENTVYDMLAPGRYQLHFELEGAHIPACNVVIAHGRMTDVHLQLQAK